MKASLSWLKDYVATGDDINAVSDALTMAGLEVDEAKDKYHYLDRVIVGFVISVSPHPNADKLTVCRVSDGNSEHQVICGAPNVRADIFVPFALPGAEMPDGRVISKAEIRGVVSNGMLCSEKELLLSDESSGILIMDENQTAGTPLKEALHISDWVLDVDLTPNRPDCLSVIGIAREIAAKNGSSLTLPDTTIHDATNEITSMTSVTIEDPELCPRYTARIIKNIKIKPSPFWLKEKLISVGLRPINNIVDITNFVMMETGQPLHAFDYDELAQNRIVVRKAGPNAKFTTLDGKKRKIPEDTCMICDGEKPVGIGGVMGGLNTEVTDKTTTILLESACFSPVSIRKTAKVLGLGTDASHRFERGVDPDGSVFAQNRAAKLMAELGDGVIVGGVIDENPVPYEEKTIELSISKTNQLIGSDLDGAYIQQALESIEFICDKKDEDTLIVTPPSFRVDVTMATDLIEEVARLWGYDNIPVTLPAVPLETPLHRKDIDTADRARDVMTCLGFSEAVNYSFIGADATEKLGLTEEDARKTNVHLQNPLSSEQSVMRTSLLPGLFETVKRNISQQEKNIRLFEIGKIFIPRKGETLPYEPEILAGVMCGTLKDSSWRVSENEVDFYDMKGIVEALLSFLNVSTPIIYTQDFDKALSSELKKDILGISAVETPYTKPGRTALIAAETSGLKPLGIIGELHPRTAKLFDIKETLYLFELNMDALLPFVAVSHTAVPMSKYPAIARDLTVIVDKDVEAGQIIKKIAAMETDLVETVSLFAVYEKDPIPKDKKSLSFRILYRSGIKTLMDDMVTELHKTLSAKIIKAYNADLPT